MKTSYKAIHANIGFTQAISKHKEEIERVKREKEDQQRRAEGERRKGNKELQKEVSNLLAEANKMLAQCTNDKDFQRYMCRKLAGGGIYQCHSGLFFPLPQVRTAKISKRQRTEVLKSFPSLGVTSVVSVLKTNMFTRRVNVRFLLFADLYILGKGNMGLSDLILHHRDSFIPWLVFAKKCKNLSGTCDNLRETRFVLVNVLWESGSGGYSFEEIGDFDAVNMNRLRKISDGLSKSRESFFETVLKYLDDSTS